MKDILSCQLLLYVTYSITHVLDITLLVIYMLCRSGSYFVICYI